MDEVINVKIPAAPDGVDMLLWKYSNDGHYTTASAYEFLIANGHDHAHALAVDHSRVWKHIWSSKVPEKIRFFLWLIAKEALPTNEKRWRNHLATDARCSRCGADAESLMHLFLECPDSRQVWVHFRSFITIPLSPTMSFQNWFNSLLSQRVNILPIAVLWWLWRWRNQAIFDDRRWEINYILRQILVDVTCWRRWPNCAQTQPQIRREPGADMAAQLTVDGSWNPQRQQMGCAAIIRDATGRWVSGMSLSLGQGDAFLAELLALEHGLLHAWSLGIKKLTCFSDCIQVVQVVNGSSHIQSYWAREVIQRLRAIVRWEWSMVINHFSREENRAADWLAREASREAAPRRVWRLPPSAVIGALCQEALF